ncbi:uncharacterized protein B0T15DRAFT_506610 [Chaetomium strumarium]|uniref:MARVEL domain-containing protein n=1 Tax=Chaetomium strumarium TaxID=1170767 RepID=A0AAJ0M5Q1_9PEZI|nr:hypothetical protein B0T15DRAFT_506610 [Chaetomium strumarium]
MPPVVRDTLSLRPQGFYGYAFLITRVAQIASLAVVTGLVADLLSTETRGRQAPATSLIAVVLFTSAALLWSLLSWTGYSRRYLPYAATWSVDLVFLLAFVAIAVVLGLPLGDTRCAAVAANGRFEITAPPGTAFGRIAFPTDGRAACLKLHIVWGVLIAVCVLFAVSALSVAFLDMGERQLARAMFAAKREPRGGAGGATSYIRPINEPSSREFAPTAIAQPDATWNAAGSAGTGTNEFGYSNAPPRPSFGEDRLNLNRPVTIGQSRVGGTMTSSGSGYGEVLDQPAAARLRRPPHLENGFGLPARKQGTHNEGAKGGLRKAAHSNGSMDIPEGKTPESSTSGPLHDSRRRASSDITVRGSNIGVIPIAIMPSQYASFGKAPSSITEEEDGNNARLLPNSHNPEGRRGRTGLVRQDLQPSPTGSGILNSPHESLMPKPLAVAQRGNAGRQQLKEEPAQSGWWGALASVIDRPQAAYDPSNVV